MPIPVSPMPGNLALHHVASASRSVQPCQAASPPLEQRAILHPHDAMVRSKLAPLGLGNFYFSSYSAMVR